MFFCYRCRSRNFESAPLFFPARKKAAEL